MHDLIQPKNRLIHSSRIRKPSTPIQITIQSVQISDLAGRDCCCNWIALMASRATYVCDSALKFKSFSSIHIYIRPPFIVHKLCEEVVVYQREDVDHPGYAQERKRLAGVLVLVIALI